LERMSIMILFLKVSCLHEWTQLKKLNIPQYQTVKLKGVGQNKWF